MTSGVNIYLYGKALLVFRYQSSTSRSIISLSKIKRQMWDDHPFSESSKITKRTVGVEGGGDDEGGREFGQNLKRRGSVCNIWGGFKK